MQLSNINIFVEFSASFQKTNIPKLYTDIENANFTNMTVIFDIDTTADVDGVHWVASGVGNGNLENLTMSFTNDVI